MTTAKTAQAKAPKAKSTTAAAKRKAAKSTKPKATPPKRKRMGRPSSYTPETAAKICALIAEGKSQREICKMSGMPSQTTMDRWRDENAEFQLMYARARTAGGLLRRRDPRNCRCTVA